MEPLAPAYLSELAQQIGTASAFLGGFAATMLTAILGLRSDGRAARWAIGGSAVAAVAFVVAVMASMRLVAVLHPQAPAALQSSGASEFGRLMGTLPFVAGLFALLLAIGATGFLRSRRTGWATAALAAVGGLMVGSLLIL